MAFLPLFNTLVTITTIKSSPSSKRTHQTLRRRHNYRINLNPVQPAQDLRKMWDEHADCPSDAFYGLPVQPVVGNMSFHTVATITSAACTILAILLGLILAMSHLTRYTKREEQRQLVRIAVVPAIISIFCFFGIWFNSTSGFLKPIGEYYESIALVAIFLLFLTFATPMQERGHSNFSNIENLQERNGGGLLSTYYVRPSLYTTKKQHSD